ncbi:MAG: M48 family metalloprotease [Bacteroidota bacterium]
MKKYLSIACFLSVSVLVNSCSRNPVSGKKQVVLMSEAQEIAMGKEADPQIVAQFGLYPDSAIQRFIRQKGSEMAAISHRPKIAYEFKVLDSDVLNAFATPGGYVYFTRGILAHFNSEADFAGVLGHEIGHITARHSVTQQRNAILGQIGIIATAVINPELGQFAQQASQGLGLLFLKFGRDAERESDRLGVEYSTKIGYDASQMAEFFNTLKRKSGDEANSIPTFMSTHPDPGERNQTVAKLATEWKQKLNVTNPQVNRNSYLKRIEGIIYGEDPRQGFVEANVFYHPELKFQFPIPTGWAALNSPQSVQMAPKDGKALMLMTLAPGKTLQEAATAVLQRYNLQALESREVNVNGFNALSIVADQKADPQQQQQQQQQQPVRTLSYLIQQGGNIYHFVGVSTPTDFNAYMTAFSQTMQNFKELKDPAKLNKKPERVRIKTVVSDGTLDQVLKANKVSSTRLEEMAILNGMKLTDRVTKGSLVKVIQD